YNIAVVVELIDYGVIAAGDQEICLGQQPNDITFSTPISGPDGSFAYYWFVYQGPNAPCPTGPGDPNNPPAGWTPVNLALNMAMNGFVIPAPVAPGTYTYALLLDPTGTPE